MLPPVTHTDSECHQGWQYKRAERQNANIPEVVFQAFSSLQLIVDIMAHVLLLKVLKIDEVQFIINANIEEGHPIDN